MESTELEILESEIATELENTENEDTEVHNGDNAAGDETGNVSNDMESELLVSESVDYTETLTLIRQNTDYLPTIAGDVRVLLVVAVLTFCWSCMRSWRVHVMGGRK